MHWLAALLPLLLLAAVPARADPMLVGVGPDLPAGIEAVAVGSDEPWDLAGWRVEDGEGAVALPARRLEAGAPLWLANDAVGWANLQGPGPTVAWNATGQFRLADSGESISLVDPAGRTVDSFAWGEGRDGAVRYTSERLLYLRDRGWPDTDQPADWTTPRAHRVGESAIPAASFTANALTLYSSPDSSHQVLSGLIAGARERLHLHVYEFGSLDLADRLATAKRDNPALDLQVLVDIAPVGLTIPRRHAETQALLAIQEAGGRAFLGGHGRYDDHHLKVLIADDTVAVQSENWVDSGVPRDPTAGNRGWGVAVHDTALADWFAAWMAQDRAAWDTQAFDAAAFDPTYAAPGQGPPRSGSYGLIVPAHRVEGSFRVTPLVAPDHTQDPRADPVAALVDAAQKSVSVQQLDLATGASNPLGWSSADPLSEALARAAARGVNVRVQAATPFSASDDGNRPELEWLRARGVQVQEIARDGISTLHNKGLVIDGRIAVVGSMNGNHHSRSANREVTLVVEGAEVAGWFAALFESDWSAATAPPDPSVIGKDLRGLPGAPLPSLLAVAGVAAMLRVRRG